MLSILGISNINHELGIFDLWIRIQLHRSSRSLLVVG